MHRLESHRRAAGALALVLGGALLSAQPVSAACCYFSALERDVSQPGQKAFITWDPATHQESFTVQPKFEGDARDFGMVVPTPGQPNLDEMPRDFFKHLAVYTILLPMPTRIWPQYPMRSRFQTKSMSRMPMPMSAMMEDEALGVTVLEAGVVGSLDYKVLEASNAAGLFDWLKQNQYSYSGDTSTLDHYIQQGWFFTVMKIDTKQMKKGPGGRFLGEVTPTRFAFESKRLVYPLRITQISVKDRTEAIFYVQAPEPMDLEGDWSWQHSYRTMWLNSGTVCISQKQMTPAEREELQGRWGWLSGKQQSIPGYDTTKLEWAHRIGATDKSVLEDPEKNWGQLGFPDLPAGARVVSWEEFEKEAHGDVSTGVWGKMKNAVGVGQDPKWADSQFDQMRRQYPPEKGSIVRQQEAGGTVWYFFPKREAPVEDVAQLGQLKGHLEPGKFVTKFRKAFQRGEMTKDLEIVPAPKEYRTEYLRILPQSPP